MRSNEYPFIIHWMEFRKVYIHSEIKFSIWNYFLIEKKESQRKHYAQSFLRGNDHIRKENIVNGKYQGERRKKWKQMMFPAKEKDVEEEFLAAGKHPVLVMEGYDGKSVLLIHVKNTHS